MGISSGSAGVLCSKGLSGKVGGLGRLTRDVTAVVVGVVHWARRRAHGFTVRTVERTCAVGVDDLTRLESRGVVTACHVLSVVITVLGVRVTVRGAH